MSSDKQRGHALERLAKAARTQVTLAVMINQAIAARAGINQTDLQCLNLLTLEDQMTPGQLAEALAMTKGGAVTAMIDRLEKDGYVRRVRSDQDRRQVLVEVVWGSQMAALTARFRPVGDILDAVASGYDTDELAFLAEFIERSNAALGLATRDTKIETGASGNAKSAVTTVARLRQSRGGPQPSPAPSRPDPSPTARGPKP